MKQPYYETSKTTGKTYNLWGIIRILNPRQAAFYVSRGLEIQDIELSEDKSKEPILVYYFNKEETKEPYDEWCSRKQEKYGGDEPSEDIYDEGNGD